MPLNILNLENKKIKIDTRKDLANWIQVDYKELCFCLFVNKPNFYYYSFKIEKNNGKFREIDAPQGTLKFIQFQLYIKLSEIYKPTPCVFGFVKNRNIIDNAKRHCKKEWVLNIDLKDFFKQINFGRIMGCLQSSPYNFGKEAAITIAQIVCYNKVLPQGSPCSPLIANMIGVYLDTKMIKFSRKNGFYYTRYADDISLSTNRKKISNTIYNIEEKKLGNELQHIFEETNFIINAEKVFLNNKKQRQEVTGLTVNKFPNVRRSYIKTLRVVLFHCKKNGIKETMQESCIKGYCIKDDNEDYFLKLLRGKIDYIKQIRGLNSPEYIRYAKKFNEILQKYDKDIKLSFKLKEENLLIGIVNQNIFLINEVLQKLQGSCFYLENIGFITCFHCLTDQNEYVLKIENPSKNIKKSCCLKKTDIKFFSRDGNLDYAILGHFFDEIKPKNLLEVGESKKIKILDKVYIVGFPNYESGDGVSIIQAKVVTIVDTNIYVDKRIGHGTSGGFVLNKLNKLIGIVVFGRSDESSNSVKQGFIPIHLIFDDIKKATKCIL